MRHLPLLLLALAASCSVPRHVAKRTIERTLPLDDVTAIQCRSHNGDITVETRNDATDLSMRVVMSVRGHSVAEAEDNLNELQVRDRTADDQLFVYGESTRSVSRMSPSFTFFLVAPPGFATHLETHNGDIRALDTTGALDCETHNGDIRALDTTGTLDCETHNGNIEARAAAHVVNMLSHNGKVALELSGAGHLEGSITTHNGNVTVAVAETLDTSVRASTHNGHLQLRRQAEEVSISRRQLLCRLGEGGGVLAIETHNGNVEIR